MWQQYGKGKTREQLQEAHNAASTPESQKCVGCGKTQPQSNFSFNHKLCCMCRAQGEVDKNNLTRAGADRNGRPWCRAELQTMLDSKDLSDHDIAALLGRTMAAVRTQRHKLGQGRKLVKAPKPLFDEFAFQTSDTIKRVTVEIDGTKITVWSNTNVLLPTIWKAFRAKGLSADDYHAWKIGVTAGA